LNMRTSLKCLFATWTVAAGAIPVPPDLPPIMVESEEITAALEAAPLHLRKESGVFVLGGMGYRRVRDSRNGFNCLVQRDLPGAFEPRCFDAEGSATLLPVILFRAERRADGMQRERVDREVAARFQRGDFIAPRRVGICYMLSLRNVVWDEGARRFARIGPRLLFYAPNLRSADLGARPDLESRLLLIDEASESTMIVVPVASERRTRVYYLSPDNLTPLTRANDVTLADSVPRDGLSTNLEDVGD